MKFTHQQIQDVVEAQEPVSQGTWRWGHTASYVIPIENSHWMLANVRFHCEEGLQDEGEVELIEVEPKEVRTITWVKKVKSPT